MALYMYQAAYTPASWAVQIKNPQNRAEGMAAIALAVGAGGAVKSAMTTVLMSGTEDVAAMTKAASVASAYRPAH